MLIVNENDTQEFNNSEAERPAFKTTIRHLLNALSNVPRADFERFAMQFQDAARLNYLRAEREVRTLRALGFKPTFATPAAPPFDAYDHLQRWAAQLELSGPLQLANPLDPELDYRDEVTLLYLALFVAAREKFGDEAGHLDAANTPLVRGVIDWTEWLAPDLLAAPAIAQAVEVGR